MNPTTGSRQHEARGGALRHAQQRRQGEAEEEDAEDGEREQPLYGGRRAGIGKRSTERGQPRPPN